MCDGKWLIWLILTSHIHSCLTGSSTGSFSLFGHKPTSWISLCLSNFDFFRLEMIQNSWCFSCYGMNNNALKETALASLTALAAQALKLTPKVVFFLKKNFQHSCIDRLWHLLIPRFETSFFVAFLLDSFFFIPRRSPRKGSNFLPR